MNKQIQILSMIIAAIVGSSAFAQDISKPALNVDFNKMIDEGNLRKAAIHKRIEQKTDGQLADLPTADADKAQVVDFIDVEIGWGEEPAPVVDRRFDSVGEPQVLDLKLISKKKGS